MIHSRYEIIGLTIAVENMSEMVEFYSNVFDIDFERVEMHDSILFTGRWGQLKLLFCPAKLANNSAKQNRHQFDIVVSSLADIVEVVIKFGGQKMGKIIESNEELSVGIYDPDNNSIVLKQLMA